MAEECGEASSSGISTTTFGFLYSPQVGRTEEAVEEQQPARIGRKRIRNPSNWTVKHVKKPGLRKNSPCLQLSDVSDCCRKKCIERFSSSHLHKSEVTLRNCTMKSRTIT